MPFDDLGEIVVRFTGRVFLRIIVEIIFELICYYVGRVFLLIVSFGQYRTNKKSSEDGIVESVVGLAILIATFIIYVVIKN